MDEATLLSMSFDEGKAIYLWLALEGSREPRYCRLPWTPVLAHKAERA